MAYTTVSASTLSNHFVRYYPEVQADTTIKFREHVTKQQHGFVLQGDSKVSLTANPKVIA